MPLLLLFIVMPVIEMWILIQVGQQIGAGPTIALVLLTAAVGYALLKQQGFATLFRARQKMESGELPAQEMAEALILAISGALLLTPGFFTDAIGFIGLLPFTRGALIKKVMANVKVAGYQAHGQGFRQGYGSSYEQSNNHTYSAEYEVHRGEPSNKNDQSNILEGEYSTEENKKKR